MTAFISGASGSFAAAELVVGWESERTVNTRVHRVLNSEDVDVALLPASKRSGRLRYLFTELSEALLCESMHAVVDTFTLTLTFDSQPSLGMVYVATDAIVVKIDEETSNHWYVEVGFQEV